ncbi:MAG: trypsin-like peptidase domain-containing protein [Deltaproteobacteria bacterium]|nr:trypsin-like peptidase domain-containing protein [Deltaproteobacteria bacterium]
MIWSEVIHHPGATYIALHFSNFTLPDGTSLRVSDGEGGQSYALTGQGKMNAGTFWSQHVKGDTIQLTLTAGGGGHGSFRLDEYAAGFVALQGAPEAICNADDKDNAVCYSGTHPTEYARARAVARLLINGVSLCTGWLVSDDNHMLTNEHCITTASDATNTDYEFDAEAPNCGDGNCRLCHPGNVISGATFIQDNANLDYALVRFTTGNPAATYGFLEIDDRDAIPGEEIYIPQHPAGFAKELGIFSDVDGGECVVGTITEAPCVGTGYNDVGYFCDTEGGSSGSPVLARSSHKVIALHHCASCENRGVPINLVYDEIAPIIGVPRDFSYGDCNSALLYNPVSIHQHGLTALAKLGGGATQAGASNFVSLMQSQSWDLVVMDFPSDKPSGNWQTEVIDHINAGGRFVISYWDLDADPALQSALEVGTTADQTSGTATTFAWTGDDIWSVPNNLTGGFMGDGHDHYGDKGDLLSTVGASTAQGGFVAAPTTTDASVVLGSNERTVTIGYLIEDLNNDDSGNDQPDGVDIIENAAARVCKPPCSGDIDGDGICDDADNCAILPNPNQIDSNQDGYGNLCDPDVNNDGAVGIPDFNIFRSLFGQQCGSPSYDPDVDLDSDCAIGIPDFNVFRSFFGGSPGPSGYGCAGTVPCP